MAKVLYWTGSVISGSPPGLLPGQADQILAWAFSDGDAIQVTAHPGGAGHVRGDDSNSPLQPVLAVENLQVEWSPPPLGSGSKAVGTRRILFDVRNVGTSYVTDYLIAYSTINK
jgi:hypothetical protein